MAKLYVRAILAGNKTFAQVTNAYKSQVKQLLWEMVQRGELSQARFEAITNEQG